MGVSINYVSVAELKDGIDLILESEKRKASSLPVAVRTAIGVDGHFYLDIEDGRLLITPESFYASGNEKLKPKTDAQKIDALSSAEKVQLADAFDALLGVASEYGPEFFNSYHKRGGDGIFGELEKIFIKLAPDEMKTVLTR